MNYLRHLSSPFGIIILAVSGLLLTACGPLATPQPKTYVIGVANETDNLSAVYDGFKTGMTGLGYIEGQNATYLYDKPLGEKPEANETEVKRLLAQKVDLLLTIGTAPSLAAKKLTADSGLPVIFAPVLGPVQEGLIQSVSHPGGNVTGVQILDNMPKVLEWLIKIAPDVKHVYVPYNPADPIALVSIKNLPDTANYLGIDLILGKVTSGEEELAAMKTLPKNTGMLLVSSPSLDSALNSVKKLALELGIPTGSRRRDPTDMLFIYPYDPLKQGAQAAAMVDKIFKGAKPAEMPVEASEFLLVVNLKTANAIGLEVSDDVLSLAGQVVR